MRCGVLLGAATAMWCGACAGIAVEGVTWRRPAESGGAVPTSIVRITASADATLTSLVDWRERSLGENEWLMVGTSDAPASWFSVISFDLSVLPRNEPIASASLRLAVRSDPPIDPPQREERLAVHHVVDVWDEGEASWSTAPWIHGEPVAWLAVRPDNGEWDTVDLTEYVVRARGAGAERVTVALLPAEVSTGFRRLWNSRETLPEDPWTAASMAPTLEVTFGPPPIPRSAAERDEAR